jgi:hypothetical protein
MSGSHDGSDEGEVRGVLLPGPVELRSETTRHTPAAGKSASTSPAAEATAPAMLDDFRDRPTIPFG